MKTKGVQIKRHGGPEVFEWKELSLDPPSAGELLVRHTAVGLNFIDIYHRNGLYPLPLPLVPGVEAAGVVEAVGEGVDDLRVGDRIAYALPPGAYAEKRLLPANRAVKIPDGVSDEVAAAVMLKGLTAQFLARRTYVIQPGDTIIVHAAAGGVGLMVCQWAKFLGATVIGTVSTADKASLARANGCDYPVISGEEDFVAVVREVTSGRGVPVVYDSIGYETFAGSVESLQPYGLLVLFGQSSGPVPPIDPNILQRGSLYLTRPTLVTYMAERADLVRGAAELFDLIEQGAIEVAINQRFALNDVGRAHEALEARKTTGSTILVP
jgi:NADPH2:quinone reductase